jgi:hypothetical protein
MMKQLNILECNQISGGSLSAMCREALIDFGIKLYLTKKPDLPIVADARLQARNICTPEEVEFVSKRFPGLL